MWSSFVERGNLSLVCVCCACSFPPHAPTDYPTSEMAEEEGEFIKTQNEGELFMHKNYLYTINSEHSHLADKAKVEDEMNQKFFVSVPSMKNSSSSSYLEGNMN